ncbi:MAG TPA: DUF2510 domain-containing protein [Acidimicrobiales bacterium]|nr:DUF2510 domain-containing protein [Acidimicrobiales bacterium]
MTAASSPTGDVRTGTDRAGDVRTGPPGWHVDPWQRHGLRFFDGRLWTEHVADGGVASVDSSPVARLERSRPAPERAAPPADPVGARVLHDAEGQPAGRVGTDGGPGGELGPLVLVTPPDATGTRLLRSPDGRPAGRIEPGRPRGLHRLGRLLVTTPSSVVTLLVVRDAAGDEVVRLSRPRRRTAPVVDVTGPSGPLGTITADRVVRELEARVATADGRPHGVLTEAPGVAGALALTDADADGTLRGRLTPVWDVPGERHHLPPGVLLADRRPRPGEPWDEATAALVLGALLAPALLRPPPPPEGSGQGRGSTKRAPVTAPSVTSSS